MNEQYTTTTSTHDDGFPFPSLRHYIEEHTPWLIVLGTVVVDSPILAVKDTAHLNLCVGFRSEADLAAYLSIVGKPSTQEHSPSQWARYHLPATIEQRLDALYLRAQAVGLCGSPLEFLCCLGSLHGLLPGIAIHPSKVTEASLSVAEQDIAQREQAQSAKGSTHVQ